MTTLHKHIPPLFLCLALLFMIFAARGHCGVIHINATSYATVLPDGQIEVKYKIANTGNDTAHRVTVTTFLALEANKSNDLGSNPPGGVLRYRVVLPAAGMPPGQYMLAARITFNEQNGTAHRVYHFSPLPYRLDRAGKITPALSVALNEPSFNVKSFRQPGGKCKLSLTNKLEASIRPVVTFYLPDGFMTKEPERSYQLAPGEKKEDVIPLSMASSASATKPFYVVAWYEHNGIHFSQWIEGKIRVEHRPVYFRAFLVLAGMVLAIVSIVVFYRKRINRK